MSARQSSFGKFITIEGSDGAGKSTLLRLLSSALTQAEIPHVTTREPGGTPVGDQIRKILLESEALSAQAELLLFLAARAEHVDKWILPHLKEGVTVICDRFTHSTLAYQGAARALEKEFVQKACLFATNSLKPDRVFLLDIDPRLAAERMASRGRDRIERESIEFHDRVREAFLDLAREDRSIYILDARASPDAILQEALLHMP